MTYVWTVQRTPRDEWIASCGSCAWVGIFTGHHDAHYRVQLHALIEHGYDADKFLGLPHTAMAATAYNRWHGQRRIESLLSELA